MISGHQYHYEKSDYIQESLTKKQRKNWSKKGKNPSSRAQRLAPGNWRPMSNCGNCKGCQQNA